MAPEQLLGLGAGKAADFFSFGCVGYELLTARPLFTESTLVELRRRHDARPDARDVARKLPVGDDFKECLIGCLATDPAERTVDLTAIACWAGTVDVRVKPPPQRKKAPAPHESGTTEEVD
jgi:serine/threonine protein kinase